jgi:hypothetical protein
LNLNLQTPLGYETIRPVIVKSLRRTAKMATIAAEYKAMRWPFHGKRLFSRESNGQSDKKSAR